jgi:hypothetical protein
MQDCKLQGRIAPYLENGIGITNVKKMPEFIHSGKYELKMKDEGNFFVVSLKAKLTGNTSAYIETSMLTTIPRRLEIPLGA